MTIVVADDLPVSALTLLRSQPGWIGDVGTVLGRHGVNIGNFALGRGEAGAIGVVDVDEDDGGADALEGVVAEIRRAPARA